MILPYAFEISPPATNVSLRIPPWWKRRWSAWWREQKVMLSGDAPGGQWGENVEAQTLYWSGVLDTPVGPRSLLIVWGPGTPWIPPRFIPVGCYSRIHQYRDGSMCLLTPQGPEGGWSGIPDISFWLARAREWFEQFEYLGWAISQEEWPWVAAVRPLPGYRTAVREAELILLPPQWENEIPPRSGEFEVLVPLDTSSPAVLWRWRLNLETDWQEWPQAKALISGDHTTVPGVWSCPDANTIAQSGGNKLFARAGHLANFLRVREQVRARAEAQGSDWLLARRDRVPVGQSSSWIFWSGNWRPGQFDALWREDPALWFQTLLELGWQATLSNGLPPTRAGVVMESTRLASRRNAGRGEEMRKQLKEAVVVIVGAGALGSEVIHLLAQEGIGNFVLIDGDILRPENVSRHRCDLSSVGRSKVEAMTDSIVRINPEATVESVVGFLDEVVPVLQLSPSTSLVLGLTGDEGSEGLLSEICMTRGLPCLHGWLEMQGRVLRVFRTLPDVDPVLFDLQSSAAVRIPMLPRTTEQNLPAQCVDVVLPGAPTALHSSANFIVQQVLGLLQGRREYYNHWLFSPAGVPIKEIASELEALSRPYGSMAFHIA